MASENENSIGPFEQIQQVPLSTANADLSYKDKPRGHSLNNPPPDGWVFPHERRIGTGSNLEKFRAEIEARTQRGENCKAIADALNAMGVQTSDRAISRMRIKWGMRKRAQRKVMTPPLGLDAARLSVKSKVQALRKSELIRMTKEGKSAEAIYQDLTKRGMDLKKGVATVLRLQSAWGLAHDEKRWLGNFRHQCHKKAKAQQLEAFNEIAKELRIQDVDVWMLEKMSEEAARLARHELALKLMGQHAPTNPERRKLQTPRKPNSPYVRQMLIAELSNSETSESDVDSGDDSPIPVRRLRPGIVDPSSRKAQADQANYEPSYEVGDDAISMDQPSYLGDMGMDVDGDYAPLNGQKADDINDAKGDDVKPDGAKHVVAGGFESVGQTMPQSTASANFPPNPSRSVPQRVSTAPQHVIDSSRSPSSTAVTPAKRGKKQHPKESAARPIPIPAFEVPTPPAPPQAQNPIPTLILRNEEAEANKSTLSALDQHNVSAKAYKELLKARNENRSIPGSLTGLPPSAKEVTAAKSKLKEATQAMMLALD